MTRVGRVVGSEVGRAELFGPLKLWAVLKNKNKTQSGSSWVGPIVLQPTQFALDQFFNFESYWAFMLKIYIKLHINFWAFLGFLFI